MTVTAFLCSFSKKNGPILPLDLNPHQTVTLFGCRWLFNVCVRVFCAPNATILFVYIPAKIKMSFIRKDCFFFCRNRHLLQAIFPSVIQAYTQPYDYSFAGRIKLIICQIRHELSVTVHETFDVGPNIYCITYSSKGRKRKTVKEK